MPNVTDFMPLPTDSKGPSKAEQEEGDRLYEKLQKFKQGKFYKR